jgi:hypothetical protein
MPILGTVASGYNLPLPTVTGGTLASDATYYYRTFTSTANLVVSNANLEVTSLIVAGGGNGGQLGAGGAGGLRSATATLTPATYTATVGGSQTDSSFNSVTATRGGDGGWNYYAPANGSSGGSGGGGGSGSGGAGNTPSTSPSQGNNGGYGATGYYGQGGGGGGAGAVGADIPTPNGGVGSSAFSSWGAATGTGHNVSGTRYYAGGGGGAHSHLREYDGFGGYGGGGGGGLENGTINTGGGGSGRYNLASSSGGSGIVIIRYLKSAVA